MARWGRNPIHFRRGGQVVGRETDRRLRLLAVDDDPDTLLLIEKLVSLQGLPFVVRTARDGLAAYEETLRFRPDVMVVNYKMPRMDGLELCGRIRRLSYLPKPKIIVNSAVMTSSLWTKALKAGADRYLPVPFLPEQLLSAISEMAGID
jgi:CheY-like chemotaxis protein